MDNPASRMSPVVMTFTELLDEYIGDRSRLHDLSDDGKRRLAEIMFELNLRCPPKS